MRLIRRNILKQLSNEYCNRLNKVLVHYYKMIIVAHLAINAFQIAVIRDLISAVKILKIVKRVQYVQI